MRFMSPNILFFGFQLCDRYGHLKHDSNLIGYSVHMLYMYEMCICIMTPVKYACACALCNHDHLVSGGPWTTQSVSLSLSSCLVNVHLHVICRISTKGSRFIFACLAESVC